MTSSVTTTSFFNETTTSSYSYHHGNNTINFEAFTVEAIIFISINAFLLLVAFYLSIALWWYLKNHQQCAKSDSIKESKRLAPSNGMVLRRLCVIAGAILLVTTLSGVTMFVLFQFFPSATFCNWMSKGHHVLRTITEILFNAILWMRQKLFYQHPAMSHLASKTTSAVSWTFFILMLSSAGLSLFVFMFGYFPVLEGQCLMHKQLQILKATETVFFAVMVALIVVYRVLFLGLLVYPLLRHKRDMRKSNVGEKHGKELMRVIKRVLGADILCIVLFIVVAVLSSTLLADQSVLLPIILWECELVLGFIFIMLSFVDWKRRLLVWHVKRCQHLRRSTRDSSRRSVWMSVSFKP